MATVTVELATGSARETKIVRGVYRYVSRTVLRDYAAMSAVMEACGYVL